MVAHGSALCCRSCGAMLAERARAAVSPRADRLSHRSPDKHATAGLSSAGAELELSRHGGPLGALVGTDCSVPLPQYGWSSPVRVCAQCFLAQTLLSYLKALQGRLASGGSFRRSAAAAARSEVEALREARAEMARVAALSGEPTPSLARAAFAAVAPLLGEGGPGCSPEQKAALHPQARRQTWALLEGHALTVRAAAFLLHAPCVMECRDDDDDDGTADAFSSAAEAAAAAGAGGGGRGSIFCALVARLLVLAQPLADAIDATTETGAGQEEAELDAGSGSGGEAAHETARALRAGDEHDAVAASAPPHAAAQRRHTREERRAETLRRAAEVSSLPRTPAA